jgi:hypothetical protein
MSNRTWRPAARSAVSQHAGQEETVPVTLKMYGRWHPGNVGPMVHSGPVGLVRAVFDPLAEPGDVVSGQRYIGLVQWQRQRRAA